MTSLINTVVSRHHARVRKITNKIFSSKTAVQLLIFIQPIVTVPHLL